MNHRVAGAYEASLTQNRSFDVLWLGVENALYSTKWIAPLLNPRAFVKERHKDCINTSQMFEILLQLV